MSKNSISLVMKYWDADSNCAQSVSCGLLDSFNFKEEKKTLHPALINFGGGFGEGSICGANSGSLAAMGVILSKKGLDYDKITELREIFKEKIIKKFNSLRCRDYMKQFYTEDGEFDWDRDDRREKCTEIVQGVFIEAKKIIEDYLTSLS